MATINYTSEENVIAGIVKVEWAGLSANDDGQMFDCTGLKIASVHTGGNFGSGGNLYLHASNELSPSSFLQWQKIENPSIGELNYPMFGAIKPVADAAISSVKVAIIFVR